MPQSNCTALAKYAVDYRITTWAQEDLTSSPPLRKLFTLARLMNRPSLLCHRVNLTNPDSFSSALLTWRRKWKREFVAPIGLVSWNRSTTMCTALRTLIFWLVGVEIGREIPNLQNTSVLLCRGLYFPACCFGWRQGSSTVSDSKEVWGERNHSTAIRYWLQTMGTNFLLWSYRHT